MPELPEVEIARRLIADLALGRRIAARRPGGSCPRCGAEMVHGTVGGRSTWWCSREQAAW